MKQGSAHKRDADRIAELEAQVEALARLAHGWRLRAHKVEDELVGFVSSGIKAPAVIEAPATDPDEPEETIEGVAV